MEGLQEFILGHHDARTVPKYRTYSVGLLGTITVSWELNVHPAYLFHGAPPDDPQHACWGTWANTQKITHNWPFELYYLDYTAGLLVVSLIIGMTLGRIHPSSADSFFLNLRAASPRARALPGYRLKAAL
jgi:hypothetical protein